MGNNYKADKTWLILAHLFNIDGNAASQTITDRIPYFLDNGISPVVLSSPTGKRDKRFSHHQVLSAAPSGFLFELRHIINEKFKNALAKRFLKTFLLILFLPFYIVEKLFVHLDSHWSWFIPAALKGFFLVRKYKPEIIYSTAGPSSTHLTGFILSRICNIPWLAELHDPLVYDTEEKKWQFYYFKKWLEKKICQHASAVIYFTQRAMENAQKRNDYCCKAHVLRPGACPPYKLDAVYKKGEKLHFGHFGKLAENRNLKVVFQALYELVREYPRIKEKVSLDVYGGGLDKVSRKCLDGYPLRDVVCEYGRLEYDPVSGKSGRQRALEAMYQCDVLLLLHGEGAMCAEYIPSKLYEYLLTGRPLLGLVEPGSELETMFEKTGHVSVDGRSVTAVKNAMLQSVEQWERDNLPSYRRSSPFTLESAAEQIMQIANDITLKQSKTIPIQEVSAKQFKKVLIVMRRSLGDVLATSPLVNALHDYDPDIKIDLLVNDDTHEMAKAIKHVRNVYTFSYKWREKGFIDGLKNEFSLLKKIFGKYDLAISLTANERSTIYAILAGKVSVAATDRVLEKSWWRKMLLSKTYMFKANHHIVLNILATIESLGIPMKKIILSASYSKAALLRVRHLLDQRGIRGFLIFHPSARFEYKIYPRHLRDKLLHYLDELNIPIVITGGKSDIDLQIARDLPELSNVYNFVGRTTLEEAIVMTDLSMGYVGMDTFNMHIAAALNKKVVAIFGPTFPQIWSPWSNELQTYAKESKPIQRYGNITLLQADMKCVACGLAGCDDKNSFSECLYEISPETIFEEVKKLLASNGHKRAVAG